MKKLLKGKIVLICTLLAIVAALYLGFFAFDKTAMEKCYRSYTYYFLLLAIILWLQQAVSILKPWLSDARSWLRYHACAVVLAAVLIVSAIVAVPAEFRILADETNLLGTSMAMYDSHQSYNPTQVMFYYHGMKRVVESVIDMRPAFFPFQVAVAHSLLGYDPANGFVVNALAAFAILLLLYLLVEPVFGRFYGNLAMVLLAAYPLFVMYTRSCGFEIYNLLWVMILIFCLQRFFCNRNVAMAELIFLTLPLLAQTRYESILAVFCVVPVVLYCLNNEAFSRLTFRSCVVPFLFLPVAWLRVVTFSHKAFQVDSVGKAFGFDILFNNLKSFIPFFFGENRAYGMVPIISFLAVVGLVKLLIDFITAKKNERSVATAFLFTVFAIFSLHALARFSYFWGNLTLQYTSRLGIVFLPLWAFLAVYAIRGMVRTLKIDRSWFIIVAFALMVYSWPVAAKNLGVRDILFYREFKSVSQFLNNKFPGKQEFMIVSDLANLYVPFRYSAVYTGYANLNPGDLLAQLERKTYREILVVQKMNRFNGVPAKNSAISDSIKLEKLFETQLTVNEILRISRVSNFDLLKNRESK